MEGAAFVYGVGDTIDITWTATDKKLIFTRRHGIEKSEVTVPMNDEDAKKAKFFTMLTGPGDVVEIVE